MDFFSAQDKARATTRKLVILYIFAIAALIVSVYFIIVFSFLFSGLAYSTSLWFPEVFFWVSIFTLVIISIGTFYRIYQLRSGGSAVARMLGGRRVDSNTTNPDERRLINVVEEMSIASGIPVPEIYILDKESTINAFAAGYTIRDAAVGVTKGTLTQLTRDELQGVIAHEFSHIFNGDMKINIRLIGILNGILLIHLLGMMIMRSGFYTNVGRGRNSKNTGGIMIFGFLVMGVGYIGFLFGRMIQSAVSRQREYLADAAAVQFTRNPDGISGALHKISASFEKPTLNDPHAMEVSHLFFSNSFKSGLDSLFATHPPIKKRIKAIGALPTVHRKSAEEPERKTPKKKQEGIGSLLRPELILAAIGTISSRDLTEASNILKSIPEHIRAAVYDTDQAQALVFSLLLSDDSKVEQEQLSIIKNRGGKELDYNVFHMRPHLKHLKETWHLPIVELSIPALRKMGEEQFNTFKQIMSDLVEADNELSLFEFALQKIVTHQLESEYSKIVEPTIIHTSIKTVVEPANILLRKIAEESDSKTELAFNAGWQHFTELDKSISPVAENKAYSFQDIDEALEAFAQASGEVKKHLLAAVLHTISADGEITKNEVEWVRAIASAIDCPLPVLALS